MLDRAGEFGFLESFLQQANPGKQLVVRNLSWSADAIDVQPRPANLATVDQHLTHEKADIIFAAYGFNESFAGPEGIPEFERKLEEYLTILTRNVYNGKSAPRIVLLSPTPNEDVDGCKAATRNNANIAAYTAAMARVAKKQGCGLRRCLYSAERQHGG